MLIKVLNFIVSLTMHVWMLAWFTRMQGEIVLPPSKTMWEEVTHTKNKMLRQFYWSLHHRFQVSFRDYMDEFAELIGCRPKLC